MPPAALIPVHTIVMLGAGITRTMIMWRHVMRHTVIPFVIGAAIGAAAGAKMFVSLSPSYLQLILGVFMLLVTWMPSLGRVGAERGRFTVLGFGTTFLGVFVSATGTLLAPFIMSATPDRRVAVATLGALMSFVHIAKLIAFGFIGFAVGKFVPLIAAALPFDLRAQLIQIRNRQHRPLPGEIVRIGRKESKAPLGQMGVK